MNYDDIQQGDTVIFYRKGDISPASAQIGYCQRNWGDGKLQLLLLPATGGMISMEKTVYHKDHVFLRDRPQLAGMSGVWDYKASDKARVPVAPQQSNQKRETVGAK